MSRRPPVWPHVLLALWSLATVAALTWPVYAYLGNHIDPLILGLPFSMAWIVGWSLATFAFLTIYYLVTERDA